MTLVAERVPAIRIQRHIPLAEAIAFIEQKHGVDAEAFKTLLKNHHLYRDGDALRFYHPFRRMTQVYPPIAVLDEPREVLADSGARDRVLLSRSVVEWAQAYADAAAERKRLMDSRKNVPLAVREGIFTSFLAMVALEYHLFEDDFAGDLYLDV